MSPEFCERCLTVVLSRSFYRLTRRDSTWIFFDYKPGSGFGMHPFIITVKAASRCRGYDWKTRKQFRSSLKSRELSQRFLTLHAHDDYFIDFYFFIDHIAVDQGCLSHFQSTCKVRSPPYKNISGFVLIWFGTEVETKLKDMKIMPRSLNREKGKPQFEQPELNHRIDSNEKAALVNVKTGKFDRSIVPRCDTTQRLMAPSTLTSFLQSTHFDFKTKLPLIAFEHKNRFPPVNKLLSYPFKKGTAEHNGNIISKIMTLPYFIPTYVQSYRFRKTLQMIIHESKIFPPDQRYFGDPFI